MMPTARTPAPPMADATRCPPPDEFLLLMLPFFLSSLRDRQSVGWEFPGPLSVPDEWRPFEVDAAEDRETRRPAGNATQQFRAAGQRHRQPPAAGPCRRPSRAPPSETPSMATEARRNTFSANVWPARHVWRTGAGCARPASTKKNDRISMNITSGRNVDRNARRARIF